VSSARSPKRRSACRIRSITQQAEASGYKMSSFVLGIVNSPAFRSKRADVATDENEK
jgi:hypothetical protein